MILTYQHCKEMHYCNKGLREFFALHDLDYQDFKVNGIHVDILNTFDDALCQDIIDHATRQNQELGE